MAQRSLSDWLSMYLKYTEDTESPLSYHTWVGVSILAGALQRRVYLKWGHSTIYPNQYIVLVGPSGRVRKGDAITIGRDLLEDVGIPISAERITREALIRFIRNSSANYTDPGDKNTNFKVQAAITCIAEELSVFIGQREMGLLSDLTTWYDSRQEWTYETKGSGTDKVMGMCFNLLAATAPDWMPSMFPQEAVGGGFTSRCIFIYEDRKRRTVTRPTDPDPAIREHLLFDLEQISTQINGQMEFTDEAQDAYDKWYLQYDQATQEGYPPIPDPRFDGYVSRRATHARKISMAISASRSNDLKITANDFNRARTLLEAAEKKMSRAFEGIGRARFSEATEVVLHFIEQEGSVLRSRLMSRFYRDIDAFTLDAVEKVLLQMKVISITLMPEKGDKLYTCNPTPDHTDTPPQAAPSESQT